MKLLPKTITIGSGANQFTYKELIRKGMHAVYEQWQHGRIVAYEAIRIMSHNGYEVNGVNIPAAESMPSASAWGIHGFTYSFNSHTDPKTEAIKRLARMVSRV